MIFYSIVRNDKLKKEITFNLLKFYNKTFNYSLNAKRLIIHY